MKIVLILSVLVSTTIACTNANGKTCIQIFNNCPFKIWPGILGPGNPENGGFALDSKKSKDIYVQDRWTAGRIWARTGCDGQYNCETGFCKFNFILSKTIYLSWNSAQCSGAGGVPPVSLAEFTLGGDGNQDFYDVSLVDGYNVPVVIEPIDGTFNSKGGEYDCKKAGTCSYNINVGDRCPAELQVKGKAGNVVACKSACVAFNTDQYCCKGANNTPATCNPTKWPKNYAALFKKACPGAYSYAYDDKTSTFTCRGKNTISPSYKVTFC